MQTARISDMLPISCCSGPVELDKFERLCSIKLESERHFGESRLSSCISNPPLPPPPRFRTQPGLHEPRPLTKILHESAPAKRGCGQ